LGDKSLSASKKDLASEVILKYRHIWSVDTLPFVFEPELTWEFRPEWDNPTPNYIEEISEIRRILDSPPNPMKIDTPKKFLVAINYWLRFIKVFSQDKDLKKLDCTVIVRKGYELSNKADIFLEAPIDKSFDPEATALELERICQEIYMEDESLRPDHIPVKKFSHSSGFTSVSWGNEKFIFTHRQAYIVETLFIAFKDGNPDIGRDTIFTEVDGKFRNKRIVDGVKKFRNKRMVDAFKSRPGVMGDLIISKSPGTYRLNF